VQLHTFGATTVELLALRDWLTGLGVTRVGMESTPDYWRVLATGLPHSRGRDR
jgi:hypothetical protein